METYKIKLVAPCEKIPWRATTFERNIDAITFNDLIDKALTSEDIKAGVRILKIEFYSKVKHDWLEVKI